VVVDDRPNEDAPIQVDENRARDDTQSSLALMNDFLKLRLEALPLAPDHDHAPNWADLGGKWAVPGFDRNKYATFEEAFANGETYGQSIFTNYYIKAFQ
jgi:hypothetical protein